MTCEHSNGGELAVGNDQTKQTAGSPFTFAWQQTQHCLLVLHYIPLSARIRSAARSNPTARTTGGAERIVRGRCFFLSSAGNGTERGNNTIQHVHAQHCLSGPSKCALRFVLLHFFQLCSHFSPLFHTSRCIFNGIDKQCPAYRLQKTAFTKEVSEMVVLRYTSVRQ